MSDHLPECPSPQIAQAGHAILSHASCICDRLRACEQRVTEGWYGVSNFTAGFGKGLDAARGAVAALNPMCSGLCECLPDALAAIDALRGES